MIALIAFWVVLMVVSYHYFHYLFQDLGLNWSPTNQVVCFLLSVAGPAAMVLALVVDGTRPLTSLV